jgi:mitogen-activated protein kinase kinase kinase
MCQKLVKLSCFWIPEHASNYLSGDNLVWSMSWAAKATIYLFRLQQLTVTQGEIISKSQLDSLLNALKKFQSRPATKEIWRYHRDVLTNLVSILKPYFPSIQEPSHDTRQEIIFKDISRYEFMSELGSGSHGKVFKSFDTLERKLVAIKLIPCTEAVEAEARILMMMDHQYIVRYQNVIQKDNNMYLIMEYCEGNNLSFFRKAWKSEKLKEDKIRIIGRQILIGLAYLHAHHIVHRDIKPENIFLTGKGIVKIGDFGEAHLYGYNDRKKFDLSSLLGTVSFMAPECLHDSNAGSSADIWSFGCLLFFLITGKRPWADLDDNLAILYHMAMTEDRPHSESLKDTSDELKEVLDRCFIRNPKTRPTAVNLLESQFFAGAVECLD